MGRLVAIVIAAALALAIVFVGANLRLYSQLIYERPVAQVAVAAVNPAEKRYSVTVQPLQGPAQAVTCELTGDEWVLGARVQKWAPWLNIVGLNATYALDQLSNKYVSADEANGRPITACDVRPRDTADPLLRPAVFARLASRFQIDERRFGSANYMPLADGAVYIVLMTQTGLNAEPLNDAARAANQARP
jgi:hypothetical protein